MALIPTGARRRNAGCDQSRALRVFSRLLGRQRPRSKAKRLCAEKLSKPSCWRDHVENTPCGYCVRDIDRVHGACIRAGPARSGGRIDLRCSPRVGLIVGSRQNLRCVFRSNATGRTTLTRGRSAGWLDVGITGGGRLFWGVFAPTSRVGYGVLRGTYVGASGNASLGLGLGAKVLVGGSNRTIRCSCCRSKARSVSISRWAWHVELR